MQSDAEIMEQLRRIYVGGVRDWDEDYEAYSAELSRRVGCLSNELARVAGTAVGAQAPTGDVHYYSFEIPVNTRPGRFRTSVKEVEMADGEAIFLVVYCSTILPLVEIRWHSITLDAQGRRVRASCDVRDEKWLSAHAVQADLSLQVVEAAALCGWQVLAPDLADQPAPTGWPWPLAGYDYQDGEYKVRDYIMSGMRDY